MKIALGTVQFGLDYGISNQDGRPAHDEVAAILDRAEAAGIDTLDTAPAYGEAETILGACGAGTRFRVVSKTPSFKKVARAGKAEAEALMRACRRSVAATGGRRLYGLLAHRTDDLLAPEGEILWRAMEALRDEGLVERIGVSFYDPARLEPLMERYSIDLVQGPLNVFDQRLARNGRLDRLKAAGVEVHVRSALLQGLLVMEPTALPDTLAAWRPALVAFRDHAARYGRSPLAAAIGFAASVPGVDRVVCGCNSVAELAGQIEAAGMAPIPGLEAFAREDPALINPNNWKKP